MKSIYLALSFLTQGVRKQNLQVLGKLLLVFIGLVSTYTLIFHVLMSYEGQQHSWITGLYWTLVVMSTLGFGDITFTSDLGRLFSVVVLLSGTVFMLVLLPYMFIQFFYVPWMEAQEASRAPRQLAPTTRGHVLLTGLSPMEQSLIRLLRRSHLEYAILVSDAKEALALYDEGYRVMVGDMDDPDTYQRARADQATLLVTARSDTKNSNVAFTVREISESIAIVATATSQASVDVLELSGCNHVLQLGEMLGQNLARRVIGRNAKCHPIGHFDQLIIAEATAAHTPLVGRTLKDIRLREHANVSVVGVWNRGKFEVANADTMILSESILLLAGTREQLDSYDSLFCIYTHQEAPVVIIGGGRVGRAIAKSLNEVGIDYRIIERLSERIYDDAKKYVHGDAAELEILEQAGIRESSSVIITTHDDDMNVYLTIYCRKLRPDMQILARANLERNVTTLHRAGADFVMSYATSGANVIFNLLKKADILLMAEGLDVFRIAIPNKLIGKTLAECQIRQQSGCNVVAVVRENEEPEVNPDAFRPLPSHGTLIVIGDIDAESRFFNAFID